MDKPHKVGESASESEKFLLEEYKNLLTIDASRNERLDRFLTMFLSLAGAPWALYALVIKDKDNFALSQMPQPIAILFLLVGLLGFLVVMMYIQARFMIIGYMRAVNAIRGYFADNGTEPALCLPTDKTKPPYTEKGSFFSISVFGMAVVNGGYISLALYRLLSPQQSFRRWAVILLAGIGWLTVHKVYYKLQAAKRETRHSKTGRMTFGESATGSGDTKPRRSK